LQKAEGNAEILGKLVKGGDGSGINKAEMLKMVADALARNDASKNLVGTISYKRLDLDQSTTDPFTGQKQPPPPLLHVANIMLMATSA